MHLRIISTLLSPSSWTNTFPVATVVSTLPDEMIDIISYLLRRDIMIYIARALEQVVCYLFHVSLYN